jgi:putative N6-adenine-specific DNA methylase
MEFELIAKTFSGLEEVLATELTRLGANNIQLQRRAVSFTGDKRLMYKANIHLRTAIRILKPVMNFKATNADEVYDQVKNFNWGEILDLNKTFAIDATVYSEEFKNSRYVTYRVKDAIVDWFTERFDKRPSVRAVKPDILINVHIAGNRCTVSIDSSGESLHKRGYRISQNEAPISEALAAGMLLMAGWDGKSDFVDPMCGSGTFLIEAALIALKIPPGIFRPEFGFEKWSDFDKELFDELYHDDSEERPFNNKIYGYDISHRAVKIAKENINSAGLGKYIEVKQTAVRDLENPSDNCLIVTNPPYGERISSPDIFGIYADLGSTMKHKFNGSTFWVISSHEECLAKISMKPSKRVPLLNGALECWFNKYEVFAGKRKEFLMKKDVKKHN